MGRPDFLVVGHVTKDLVPGGFRWGGTATYSAITASRLGWRAGVVTSAGPDFAPGAFLEGIEVSWARGEATTTFKNVYRGGGRRQWLRARAGPITLGDIPQGWREAPIIHLGPVANEVDPHIAPAFSGLVGVTAQGWMRGWDAKGRVYPVPWESRGLVLPHTRVLILSEQDAPPGEILDYASQVPLLVVTQGQRGARIHWRGEWHQVPSFPVRASDPTGTGDAFAAAYLIALTETGDALYAGLWASCVASFAIEGEGTQGLPWRRQVEGRLRESGVVVR